MAAILVDILEEHFEELQFLWPQRRASLRSPKYSLRELGELEARIEAHVQGLLVGGTHTCRRLEPVLADDDAVVSFAAAYTLLRFEKADIHAQALETLLQKPSDGIVEAFCHAPVEPILSRLRSLLGASPSSLSLPLQAALAEILGFHNKLDIKTSQLNLFLQSEDVKLRRSGWRIARYLPARTPEIMEAGWKDADRGVAAEALESAAWCRHAPLLAYCRHAAAVPAPERWDAIYLAAVLGKAGERGHILQLASAEMLGPLRFRALGAYGHPSAMPAILSGMESKDPRTAVAAGAAFTKITGCDVTSSRRVVVPPVDGHEPDDFEREFLDEVKLPDVAQAQAHWKTAKDSFSKGTRYCRGLDISNGVSDDQLAQLDLESRWEAILRTRFERVAPGSPASHARFPQLKVAKGA